MPEDRLDATAQRSTARNDLAQPGCERVRGFVRDPAVWAWAFVALLALLPLRVVLAGA